MHWGRVLLALFRPSARLLQSIRQMAELGLASCLWITPLQLAACAYVGNAAIHCDLFTCSREGIHDQINAVTITLALLILSLSVADWHVPRWLQHHQLLCRLLTAMCMHTLRMDCRCTIMAFLVPTFGKRPQEEDGAARKRITITPARGPQTDFMPSLRTYNKKNKIGLNKCIWFHRGLRFPGGHLPQTCEFGTWT